MYRRSYEMMGRIVTLGVCVYLLVGKDLKGCVSSLPGAF